MSNIIDFLIRCKNTLLFVFLLLISLFFTFQTHSYQRSKFINSANNVTGKFYSLRNDLHVYFQLKESNTRLLDENRVLRQRLLNIPLSADSLGGSEGVQQYEGSYSVFDGKVIANQYANLDNYILIDKGVKDSITEELGVITSDGIIGVVEKSSPNYSRVISILNTNLAINAQLKNSDHFGTLVWEGKDPNMMQLTDVPKRAEIEKGDTIITNGRSLIFPKGIPIGKVDDFKMDKAKNYYLIDVELFNDMTSIGDVYIIENKSIPEIDSLNTSDEQ